MLALAKENPRGAILASVRYVVLADHAYPVDGMTIGFAILRGPKMLLDARHEKIERLLLGAAFPSGT